MIANTGDLQEALELAGKAYVAVGGKETDGVYFTIIVSNQGGVIAASPETWVDLEECRASFLTFEREGSDPVEIRLEEELEIGDILDQAGIDLLDDEKVYDVDGNVVDMDGAYGPDGEDATYTIRKVADADKSGPGGGGAG